MRTQNCDSPSQPTHTDTLNKLRPRTSVPIVSIETHIHTSFIVKADYPAITT